MSYHRDLHKLRQTIKNAESASGALRITDTALQQVGDLMIDARNKAVAMASDTVSESARPAVAAEIQLMIDQMLQKANTEFGGRYIFSGHRVLIPPYQQVDGQIKYLGDQGKMAQKVELSGSVVINIPGTEIFGAPIASFSLVAPDSAIAGGAGLDDGVIAAELNTAFANDGITLSTGATVTVMEANERWQITDNTSTYYIES